MCLELDIKKIHYLRNEFQTLCGRDASRVKSSTLLQNVDCSMCLNSFPIEIPESSEIIKILQDKGYELDGTRPVFIKIIDDKLFIRRSRWMSWDKTI